MELSKTREGRSPAHQKLLAVKDEIDPIVFAQIGTRVKTGPFVDMEIPEKPIWDDGNSISKLLGCYERELQPMVEKAIERKPTIVINVGCAEGYYAIGFARRLPSAVVYAADISGPSLNQCVDYAKRNAVGERVKPLLGCTTPSELKIGGEGRRLFFLDCEGFEIALLNPQQCPELSYSDIIVECHDFLVEGCSAQLRERFQASHDVTLIHEIPTPIDLFPQLNNNVCLMMRALMILEIRPVQTCWLVAWAKEGYH